MYDIAYQYAFTYNPHPVYLVAAFEHQLSTNGPSASLSAGNCHVQTVWEEIVGSSGFAKAPDAPQVGWLNTGISLSDIAEYVTARGLVRYDLRKPKPPCARPRDSQAKQIPHGAIPPLRRFKDWG
jgi:hypothetical protein